MTIGLATSVRNSRMNVIRDAIDAGAGSGLIRLYTEPRPATGGAVTTLLAELTFSGTSYAAASSGSITANTISQDPSANATGTAVWARVVDSTGQFVFDCDVGTSGSDINLNSTGIATGLAVEITSSILTDGNA